MTSYLIAKTMGVGALLCLTSAALAQDEGSPDHLKSLQACQQVVDDTERLACFDAAVSAMVTATETGELRVVDKEDVTKTRRRLFGFSLPDIGIFGGDDEDDELSTLESTITSVRYFRHNALTFRIEEGGLWRIQSAPRRLRRVKSGDKVVFKKAALGSYFIRINGQTGVKGTRIE